MKKKTREEGKNEARREVKKKGRKERMSESSKKQMHSLRRFADKTFLRRKTTTDDFHEDKQAHSLTANDNDDDDDDDEISAPSSTTDVNEKKSAPSSTSTTTTAPVSEPSSTAAVSASGSSWTTVSVPRSHIPTPSISSRRHTCSSRSNVAAFSPPVSPRTSSQIPRSITMQPFGGFASNVFSGGSPTPNQDGRYPFLSMRDQRKSDVGDDRRPIWGTYTDELSHHDDTAETIMPSTFMSANFGSDVHSGQREIAGHRNLKPALSWPLSLLTQPNREGDDDGDTPTMKRFTNLDESEGIVNSPTFAIHPFGNATTSHSSPASRYRISSDMPKESSAWATGFDSPFFAMPNYGGYSFDVSDQTIGLALTTPPEGDRVYDTAIRAAEPFAFETPDRFSISSAEIPDYQFFESNNEVSQEPEMEIRISPHMNEEGLGALEVSSQPASLSLPLTSPNKNKY